MSKKLDIDSRNDLWISAFRSASNNKKAHCPRCGSDRIQTMAKVVAENKGFVVITCSDCGKSGYFSRVNLEKYKGKITYA